MTNTYHTAIATNAAANASVFNAPLGQLDAILGDSMSYGVNNNAELAAARSPYASLNDRLNAFVFVGSNVSTQANGAASAGQKVVAVDSTSGFLPGAPVAYELAGGVVETNTIDTVDSPTQLTLVTNIGTGGIANNEYIAVINPGSLVSTGAVNGATAQQQRFVQGAFLGANASLVADDSALLIGRAAVNPLGSGGSHGVRDESTYYYAAGGYASFDANPEAGGAGVMNHVNCFQARPKYSGVGLLDAVWGMTFQPTITGPVTLAYGVYILNPTKSGAGSIDVLAGVYVNTLTAGTVNYGVYVEGNNLCYFGGGALLGGVTGGSWSATVTSAVTDSYGFKVANPGVSGAGAITNLYGLYIGTLSRGGSANYAIYVEGANTTYLGGPLFHNGASLGFYGTSPIAKQTGVAVSAGGIHAALVALGLIAA